MFIFAIILYIGRYIRIMTKYVDKILSFLSNVSIKKTHKSPIINTNNNIHDNESIKKILKCAYDAYVTDHDIKIIEQYSIRQIHTCYEYPMSYILFKCLDDSDMMKHITNKPIHITDLQMFMRWYRENINNINFAKLHNMMKNIDDNQKYDELKNAYGVMFKTYSSRVSLHHELYGNKYISLDIQHNFESVNLDFRKYMIGDKHMVQIFTPMGFTPPDITIIAIIIDTLDRLARSTDTDTDTDTAPVNLTILYSDQKKIIPSDYHNNVLCCDNINSGSTYPGHSIVCWRREELYKILIHELYHYYKFDFNSYDQFYEQFEAKLRIPPVAGDDYVNESYTESCAILILIILRYVFDNISKNVNPVSDTNKYMLTNHLLNNHVLFNSFFIKALKTELMFVMYQIAKFIILFGGREFKDYETKKIIIKQKTSARSYFVIKLILLSNLDALLGMMNKTLYVSGSNLYKFGKLINESWDVFIASENPLLIDGFIDVLHQVSDQKDSKWIHLTCRMSANDMLGR